MHVVLLINIYFVNSTVTHNTII